MSRLIFSLALAVALLQPAAAAENLLVFVGEKISVEEFTPDLGPDEILMDGAFKAKYRVIDVVYGEYSGQTIEFEAYDHYGRPGFEPHKNVLLFVSKDGGRYFHQKYQYFPVFRTLSGVWAGCGSPYAYEPEVHHGNLKPQKLDFGSDAYFDITGLTRRDVRERFPRAHYLVKDGRAYCTEGNSATELFEVKKQGVLKARGLFKSAANNSFKPKLLRSGISVAGEACHAATCATQFGLTQVLAFMANALARVLWVLALVAPSQAMGCEVLEKLPHPGTFKRVCPNFPCPPMYPRTAVRERLEGNVVLRVRVAADGSVLGASILKASAHSVLDEAAVQYVRASHFPVYTPPGSSAPACYLVRVPIAFRFEGSVDKS